MRPKTKIQTKSKENPSKESEPPPLLKIARKLRTLNDAKRLMSTLISKFCRGQISDRDSKTLTYLIISFVSIAKDSDLESRIKEIEAQLEMKR